MPAIRVLAGTVASPWSPANTPAMIPAVLTMTMLLPPASPWATASTKALRRAKRSPATASVVSAIADMSPRRKSHVNRALVAAMAAGDQRSRRMGEARPSLTGMEQGASTERGVTPRRCRIRGKRSDRHRRAAKRAGGDRATQRRDRRGLRRPDDEGPSRRHRSFLLSRTPAEFGGYLPPRSRTGRGAPSFRGKRFGEWSRDASESNEV